MKIQDKLRIISKISSGNFGDVLLCENTYLANRREAVKYIKTQNREEVERIAEVKKNLFECSVLEYLRKSNYIVEIYDAEVLQDGFRINMEFLEKGSVQDLLNKIKFLDAKQALKIAGCVLHALEYAHNKSILHLDVKPGNILIKNENTYKLSDFGLANIRDEKGNSAFKQIYTMHVPPEKISGSQNEATEQSDIYMFGVTLYRLLNGDSYVAQQWDDLRKNKTLTNAIISGKFPDRNKYLPHINKKLIKIINKCLDVNLSQRYKSIRDVRIDLGKIKIKNNWIPKDISANLHYWKCFVDDRPYLEIIGERNQKNLWNLSLLKYGKSKKLKISKYCAKSLKEKDFYKKFNIIFQKYF